MNKSAVRIIRKFFQHMFKVETMRIRKKSLNLKIKQFGLGVERVLTKITSKRKSLGKGNSDKKLLYEIVARIVNQSMFEKMHSAFKSEETEEIRAFINNYNTC